ncbi:MAG TPA: alpha/beta hydrolase [Myxococcota bacterium]|nr:alpha/beta hydrolase [Myxococcota bacterium]
MARVATADGYAVHAEAHGDGPPIVFSCALATTRENWRPQVAPLVAAGLRVVLWDYRGHGLSDAPDDPNAYSLECVVDDLARVLDFAAPGEAAVLAGLSFGGLASLHLALREPARARALVLVGSGPGFKNADAQARWEAMVERTASFVEAKGMRAFVESRASATLVGLRAETAAARAAADAIAAQTPHGVAHFARRIAGPAPPVLDRLGEIRAPALVMVGERDEQFLRAADVMAARLAVASREVFPGAGHIVNLDAPDAFDAALLGFLVDQGIAPRAAVSAAGAA